MSPADSISFLKLPVIGVVIGEYFAVFLGVMRIMRQTRYVTGSQLADGPLFHLGAEMWFLVALFAIDLLEE